MKSKTIAQNKALISFNTTSLLKVLFCLMVLIHHMFPAQTDIGHMITSTFGPIAVGGFFLLSGYGVTISLKTKGEVYLKKLIKVKAIKFYLYVVAINALAAILFIVFGGHFEGIGAYFASILHLPFFSSYIPMCSWLYFLVQLAIYYVLFVVFAKIYKNHPNRIFLVAVTFIALAFAIIGILTCVNATTGSERAMRACFCFPAGILLANYSSQVNAFCQKIRSKLSNKIIILFFVLVFYAVSLMLVKNTIFYEYITPLVITLYIVFLLSGKDYKNVTINMIAPLTLDIYLFHQIYFMLFRDYIGMSNRYLIFVAVIMYSLITALFINWIKSRLNEEKNNTEVKPL